MKFQNVKPNGSHQPVQPKAAFIKRLSGTIVKLSKEDQPEYIIETIYGEGFWLKGSKDIMERLRFYNLETVTLFGFLAPIERKFTVLFIVKPNSEDESSNSKRELDGFEEDSFVAQANTKNEVA